MIPRKRHRLLLWKMLFLSSPASQLSLPKTIPASLSFRVSFVPPTCRICSWLPVKNQDDDDNRKPLVVPVNELQKQIQRHRRMRQRGVSGGVTLIVIGSILGVLSSGTINVSMADFHTTACTTGIIIMAMALQKIILVRRNKQPSPGKDPKHKPLPYDDFYVQESRIPDAGQGLFTKIPLRRGSYLFDYEGEILTETDYFQRYPTGDSRYVVEIPGRAWVWDETEPVYIDAADVEQSNLARFINSQPGPMSNIHRWKHRINATAGKMHLYAARDIQAHEELCFDYGDQYWEALYYQKDNSTRTTQ